MIVLIICITIFIIRFPPVSRESLHSTVYPTDPPLPLPPPPPQKKRGRWGGEGELLFYSTNSAHVSLTVRTSHAAGPRSPDGVHAVQGPTLPVADGQVMPAVTLVLPATVLPVRHHSRQADPQTVPVWQSACGRPGGRRGRGGGDQSADGIYEVFVPAQPLLDQRAGADHAAVPVFRVRADYLPWRKSAAVSWRQL